MISRGLAHRESLWKWRVLLPNFQWEEYSCNCAPGYSGKRCEMGELKALENCGCGQNSMGFVTATKWILIKGTKIFLNFNWPKQTRTRLQLKDYKLHTQLRAFKGCNFLNLFCSNYFFVISDLEVKDEWSPVIFLRCDIIHRGYNQPLPLPPTFITALWQVSLAILPASTFLCSWFAVLYPR